MRQPTIRDVAAKAGVSKSLVSLVMNDSPRVSEKSREAVLTAANALGYRRNAAARSLVSQRSQLIGVVISNYQEIFLTDALEGVSQYIGTEDYTAFVQSSRRERELELKAIHSFLESRMDALILLGVELPAKELETLSREVPIAIVGRPIRSSMLDVVAGDQAMGSRLVVDHLAEFGHRAIAHIDGGTGDAARARAHGFRETMQARGLEPRVVRGGFLLEGGASGAEALVSEPTPMPTAIFAPSDLAAIGARDVLARQGLNIPEDVSLVGYDDSHLAQVMGVDLTTIDDSALEMGKRAAELVISRARNPDQAPKHLTIEPHLIVRTSTGPPRAA